MKHQECLTRFVAAFVDELSACGVEHVVVSPGSRSTPLAMLLNAHSDIRVWMNIDERSAAFFALGIAKASGRPAALLCTSGTAAANYYPAIVEAKLSRVPLIVLTADRPHELRGVGAPQAIDQIKLYGDNVKWFQEMPLPGLDEQTLLLSRTTARRAIMTVTTQPLGPVHLNFPFREPLVPDFTVDNIWDSGKTSSTEFSMVTGENEISDSNFDKLTRSIQQLKRGLIVVGPQVNSELAELAALIGERLGFPVLADPLSQLRTGNHNKMPIIDCFDSFLRDTLITETFIPDGVIRIGAMPVSKPFLLYLNKIKPSRYIVIDEGEGWREPTQLATDMVYSDPIRLCKRLLNQLPPNPSAEPSWLTGWNKVNQAAKNEIKMFLEEKHWHEGQIISELSKLLPKNAYLFVGNSMPIRDLDTFLLNQTGRINTMANRGANGIDGVVSTALGVSAVSKSVNLVIGDLSFFHDMNGLLAGKLYNLNATIIVVNNDGGGIFSFLPQAGEAVDFEQLFGTPAGLDIEAVANLYNADYKQAVTWEEFADAYLTYQKVQGLKIIEIQTNRKDNTEKHRMLWNRISYAVQSVIKDDD
ncbi:2-succinyl-5-enolpyruvyl-6-hydroxy-3-cyclohexene-1-carboxylate synthase [Scopulibacillus darangshiensis]|uniref:2-succinyl-5-enolpyruvyl-6-hydroxy-3-cyclohexene-1-carboxylate synthase n=1 Tax=Scopulibacillus darangshiensis TaxID=442528 RepID=A0A4R2P780_9BACL|nr:2-succinyl-5-enolpyruvyl-6-hydroxy-3-cyclohexene-1-carboxylic-acid synthase [Scopulibacillus darangshiensis]TCP29841.1 2-succinyl-5-enolpyruvyl-6-hydroxy-3-cyclohexene-1-carboxylate synthase [Scopulibacillus darangshiensis]